MLVRVEENRTLAIGQLSHSWISGQLARAWGNERFPAPDPREEIALGAEQHDIGWARVDLEPRFNPQTGRPRSFLELTVDEHLSIWRTAPDLLMSQSAHAALVVSLHGRSLSELRASLAPHDAGPLDEHAAVERARQAQLCGALGVSEEQLERTRRQMWTWDGISLALCNRWSPFTAKDVPTNDAVTDIELRDRADGTVTLDPWPFESERVEVRCEARELAARYDSEAAMRHAFERCERVTLTFALVAA
jgi:hypothetical protein